MSPPPKNPDPERILLGRRLMAVAAVFLLVVAGLMLWTRGLLRSTDPLHAPALQSLMAQLEREPGNETLRQQVRELDLLARRAFFIRRGQLETGGWLMLGGAVVFILGLHLSGSAPWRMPDLKACPGADDAWSAAARARRWIAGGGLALLAGSLAVAFWTARTARVPAPEADPEPAERPADATALAVTPAGWTDEARRNWPSFRGAGALGVATEAEPPLDWDGAEGRGVRWKTAVPLPGFSSPIVWDNRVYLTGADAERREVYAFDADSGELLWTADDAGVPDAPETPPRTTADTGLAAPSPATDGRRVVAIFGTGVVLGLDTDGRRLWARALPVPDNHYGHSSSLLLHDGLVFVQYDHFGGAELLALDAETGAIRWRRPREADISWASPILVETPERMTLVLNAAPVVAAYDARTGEPLWSREVMSGEIGVSPAYAAGRVFAANQYAQAVALDAATGETLWASTRLELPDAASPVATDEHLFLPTAYGILSGVDAATGAVAWEHEFDRGGYGSPILVGDRLYWVTSEGVTRIVRAGPEFELLGEPALGEPSMTTPAVVGRRLFIRGERRLFCIE